MRLLFDARWIKPDAPDGITRFSVELIRELSKYKDLQITLLVTSEDQASGSGGERTLFWYSPVSPKEFFTAKKLRKYGFDAIYSPHFIFGAVGRDRKTKIVLTVMDFIPFRHKERGASILWRIFFSNKLLLRLCMRSADAIATISKTSLKELGTITSKPLIEIPCASNLKLANEEAKRRNSNSKKLLYIGRYEGYKGVEVLIRGMRQLRGYTLVLAGTISDERKAELASMVPIGCEVKFIGRITEQQYSNELISAFAAVSASTDEGFGLPVLEAMQMGVPVVCSDIEPFREVGAGVPLYFTRSDADEFARQVLKLEDTKVRRSMIEAGKIRSSKYSWSKSALKLKEMLESA